MNQLEKVLEIVSSGAKDVTESGVYTYCYLNLEQAALPCEHRQSEPPPRELTFRG
jgi:hypothetical protein